MTLVSQPEPGTTIGPVPDLPTADRPETDSAPAPAGRRAERIGGLFLLISMISQGFGVVWDVQWHNNVGPDTFLTIPHLLIYAGPMLAGVTSAIVVLLRTGAERAPSGSAGDTTSTVKVLGFFHAPVGFLVAGVGGAIDLFYGMADLWWHTEYGFDVTLNSPPHVGLALGGVAISVGTVIVFAAQHDDFAGRCGLVASSALSLITVVFALFWAQPFSVSLTFVAITVLTLVGCVVRKPGWVTATGAVFIAIVAIQWLFVPFATRAYADSLGLPFRDGVSTAPQMPGLDPMILPAVALALDLVLLRCRRLGVSPAKALPLAAAVLGVGLSFAYGTQIHDPVSPTSLAEAGVLSLFGAWVGYRFSFPLRRLARARQSSSAEV